MNIHASAFCGTPSDVKSRKDRIILGTISGATAMRVAASFWLWLFGLRVGGRAELLEREGVVLDDTTDKYFRAVPTVEAGDDLNAEFREDAARKPILEGAVVQWIVVCLCGSPEEVGRQLVSTTSTYPEADKIVLIANGFGLSGRQLAELKTLVSNQARAPVQLESTLAVVSPEQALLVAWEVLPVGAKVVAYCIRECERTAWPLLSSSIPPARSNFLHYTRVVWSYRATLEGPLIAMVTGDDVCTELQKDIVHHCQTPSLIMFDSGTVNKLGLPSEKHGGTRAWIDAATKLSMVYVGRVLHPEGAINSVPMQRSATIPSTGPALPLPHSMRMNVLVVLEGHNDKMTGPIFQDIADIVRDGLRNLGHPTRVVYCANLATEACFVSGEQLIVLAAHNLANYVTLGGALAVPEMNLIPSDAILYNFEHIACCWPQETSSEQPWARDRSLVSRDVLKIYDSYTLWEYSEQNMQNLRAVGIRSELVPLGFSPKLERSYTSRGIPPKGGRTEDNPQHEYELIDVLFVGAETPTRSAAIRRIREAGVSVVHPNSAGLEPFGAELDAISMKSKIVLSLNAFEPTTGECSTNPSCNNGEWKISRIVPLLANSRFVVAEMSGSASERETFKGGVVFVPSERLAETCLYYLQRPQERAEIAERGRQIIEQHPEAAMLKTPVDNAMRAPR